MSQGRDIISYKLQRSTLYMIHEIKGARIKLRWFNEHTLISKMFAIPEQRLPKSILRWSSYMNISESLDYVDKSYTTKYSIWRDIRISE